MSGTAVLGMQWGDEGKGKFTHLLAADADVVVRFNGGANAGHTIIHQGRRFATHLLPSGAFYPKVRCVLAAGMVIDLGVLTEDLAAVRNALGATPEVVLSENAHLVLPHHGIVEALAGSTKRLGTTARGIGPAYRDKAARTGVRVGDLRHPELLEERIATAISEARRAFPDAAELAALDAAAIARDERRLAAPFLDAIGDVSAMLEASLLRGELVLFEGAQGALLDLDYGTYPYVTSSCTTLAGIGTAIGLPIDAVDERIGIAKAYVTRVGAGPFPTEILDGKDAERLRGRGGEYGTTTGRPRRCGWPDLVALAHAARLNRPTGIAVTKLDVLSGEDTIYVCRAYEIDGKETTRFPLDPVLLERSRPVYEEIPGWQEDLTSLRRVSDLPQAARRLLEMMAEAADAPVQWASVGPAAEETIQTGF